MPSFLRPENPRLRRTIAVIGITLFGAAAASAATFTGGPGADRLFGKSGADRLVGGNSNDRLWGRNGNDRLFGGKGRDQLRGGRGRDLLSGGPGNDRAWGGSGNDRLLGGPGRDLLSGGTGRDVIKGGAGADRLFGGKGNDRILARDGRRDVVNCGPGKDVAVVDGRDRVLPGCEKVQRSAAKPAGAPQTPATGGGSAPAGKLVWGYDATPPASGWSRPALGATRPDAAYGTKIRRVSSADGTRFNRNTYSRRQAENADGSRFFTYHGAAEYRVYNRATLALERKLAVHPDGDPQWHPTDPTVIRHMAGNDASSGDLRLYETRVTTGRRTVAADLTARIKARLPAAAYLTDRAEGSPSADGSRYAWIVYSGGGDPIGVVSYDLSNDKVLAIKVGLETGVGRLDWIGMSATGRYVVAGYVGATYVYSSALGNRRTILRGGEHSDLALDAAGRDAYVYIDFITGSPDDGYLVSANLDTLARTRLFRVYGGANTSLHISGKGFGKPGWVVVSSYNCKDAGAWTCDKVMAVELAPKARVLNLAHTHNCGDDYWTETHAVVNRSFTRVYFNSDAGSCGIDAEVYEIAVPTFS